MTLITYLVSSRAVKSGSNTGFMAGFMGSIMAKFVLSIAFLLIYRKLSTVSGIDLIIPFFIFYTTYTILETVFLLRTAPKQEFQ